MREEKFNFAKFLSGGFKIVTKSNDMDWVCTHVETGERNLIWGRLQSWPAETPDWDWDFNGKDGDDGKADLFMVPLQ